MENDTKNIFENMKNPLKYFKYEDKMENDIKNEFKSMSNNIFKMRDEALKIFKNIENNKELEEKEIEKGI